ncbi:hypothetical protein LOAG_08883 [Loa loa]|uniref:Uncharacterized protein n=1 Tax=Loa loa TaxID=7209 RepID=A0A1S0TTF7_LOALO|nr:hypothetical protein LOAG_08883 [Loa loa]EFO19611.1 hypothetical protein LOAG_08883 [Loa loa]
MRLKPINDILNFHTMIDLFYCSHLLFYLSFPFLFPFPIHFFFHFPLTFNHFPFLDTVILTVPTWGSKDEEVHGKEKDGRLNHEYLGLYPLLCRNMCRMYACQCRLPGICPPDAMQQLTDHFGYNQLSATLARLKTENCTIHYGVSRCTSEKYIHKWILTTTDTVIL